MKPAAPVVAASVLLVGCAAATSPPAAAHHRPPPTVPAVTTTNPDTAACLHLRTMLPHILYWLAHPRAKPLERYQTKLMTLGSTVQAGDVQFTNYLDDAAMSVGVTGDPYSGNYAQQAAAKLGQANGYCKYDVGVKMGY